jgi:hypothetical protein
VGVDGPDLGFTTPATITLPNTGGYAPGSIVGLISIIPATATGSWGTNVQERKVTDNSLTHDFEAIVGRPATSIREYVAGHPELFGSRDTAG